MATATAAKTTNGKGASAKGAGKNGKGAKASANGKGNGKATAAERAPRARKEGLRKPQIDVLRCLSKAREPLSRKQIAEKAKTDLAFLTSHIGSHDEETRKANDKKNWPSLLGLGFVRSSTEEIDGRQTIAYEITATGRKALAKAEKGE